MNDLAPLKINAHVVIHSLKKKKYYNGVFGRVTRLPKNKTDKYHIVVYILDEKRALRVQRNNLTAAPYLDFNNEDAPTEVHNVSSPRGDDLYFEGMRHLHGIDDAPTDAAKAYKLFSLALPMGGENGFHRDAAFELGKLLLFGHGVKQAYDSAAMHLKMAAELGHNDAKNSLAFMYMHGLGIPVDQKKAAALYESAAKGGNAEAQFNVGLCKLGGIGVEQEYEAAEYWLKKARTWPTASTKNASKRHVVAAGRHLARIYLEGLGGQRDWKKAVEILQSLAFGDSEWKSDVAFDLGLLYADGIGRPVHPEKAFFWLKEAADCGHTGAAKKVQCLIRDHAQDLACTKNRNLIHILRDFLEHYCDAETQYIFGDELSKLTATHNLALPLGLSLLKHAADNNHEMARLSLQKYIDAKIVPEGLYLPFD